MCSASRVPATGTTSQAAPTCTCWMYLGRISATYSPKAQSCFCWTSFFGLTVAKEKIKAPGLWQGIESCRRQAAGPLPPFTASCRRQQPGSSSDPHRLRSKPAAGHIVQHSGTQRCCTGDSATAAHTRVQVLGARNQRHR